MVPRWYIETHWTRDSITALRTDAKRRTVVCTFIRIKVLLIYTFIPIKVLITKLRE